MAAKKDTFEFEHEGKVFTADRAAITSYRNTKAIARVESDPDGYFRAMEEIFCGKDGEYADELGGGNEAIGQLYASAAKAAGAKNS